MHRLGHSPPAHSPHWKVTRDCPPSQPRAPFQMPALHSVQAPSTRWIPGPTDPGPTNGPAVALGFHVQPDPPLLWEVAEVLGPL